MNLEQLRSFVEVARIGHFTRAASHLHLAQPSLSRQISTLEHDLGAELFHRARGNITLTAAGESLLPLARRMLAVQASRQQRLAIADDILVNDGQLDQLDAHVVALDRLYRRLAVEGQA